MQKPIQVVCAIIRHDGRVLAARRDPGRSSPLLWEFPGGKVEEGEEPQAALLRELREELRLCVVVERQMDTVHYRADDVSLDLIPFVCRPNQAEAPVPLEHSELRWVDADSARNLTWAPADIPLVVQL